MHTYIYIYMRAIVRSFAEVMVSYAYVYTYVYIHTYIHIYTYALPLLVVLKSDGIIFHKHEEVVCRLSGSYIYICECI